MLRASQQQPDVVDHAVSSGFEVKDYADLSCEVEKLASQVMTPSQLQQQRITAQTVLADSKNQPERCSL
jgi:hypothetical protein